MGTMSSRKFAVVTGASSGIGLELARQCIEHGFDVLICAEDERIKAVATELGADGRSVKPLQADLATFEGVEQLWRAIEAAGRPVDALLMNAGVGVGGEFVETPLEEELRVISLNCASLVHLSKRVLPAMKSRGKGRVLITASVASTTPAPYLAVYGASKAFALSFAEAIRYELKDSGVTVTALQPGPTDTRFFERARMEDTRIARGKKDAPAEVAREGVKAMLAGRESVIASSLMSRFQGYVNEVLPERVKATGQAWMTRPGSGQQR
jgi:uncharacterized protein